MGIAEALLLWEATSITGLPKGETAAFGAADLG